MANDNFNVNSVLDVAKATKIHLLEEWQSNGKRFVDKNYMKEEGILPHSIGLTGLLLLAVAFCDEPTVFPKEQREQFSQSVNEMLVVLLEKYEKEGFSITPYKPAEETAALFAERGYTDTVTWVLSSCVLARYAQRKNVIALDQATKAKIFEVIAKSTALLRDAQREDGTWGFRAEKSAARSLYYTYAVNASLADVYNYVLGEIEQVEEDNESGLVGLAKDEELVSYINDCGAFGDFEAEIKAVRTKLQRWLIRDCLPLLPKISDCEILTDEDNKRLGISDQATSTSMFGNVNYFNLYYAYYIIDLFVDSSADLKYKEIYQNKAEFNRLKQYYLDEALFSKANEYYFFDEDNEENAQGLCDTFIAQAIHSSRAHYLNASRTGAAFWDSNNSELNLTWDHEKFNIQIEIEKLRSVQIKEPALVPMALRANVQYCYYISRQTDKTVEDLFFKIAGDRFGEEGDAKRTKGLWDDQSYNLLITERSIEAIVDSYDYVCKFDQSVQAAPGEPQSFDALLDVMVKERVEKMLSSRASDDAHIENAVKRAVAAEVARQLKAQPAPAAQKQAGDERAALGSEQYYKQMISEMGLLRELIEAYPLPFKNSEDEQEKLVYELVECFNELQSSVLRTMYARQMVKKESNDELDLYDDQSKFNKVSEDAAKHVSAFCARYPRSFTSFVKAAATDVKYLPELLVALESIKNSKP